MANITNFKPGEALTAEALNQAFDLVGARADAVIGIAQEAHDEAAEALARVDQATERVPELIEKVEEMEDVLPTLATAESVATAQDAAEAHANTAAATALSSAKSYTDTQVAGVTSQISALSSEVTALSGDVAELEDAMDSKADADSVYTKSETYTKSQTNTLYDVTPVLSSGTVIAQVKTPAGTKPLYAPTGGGGGGGVTIEEVDAEIEEYLEDYSTTSEMNAALSAKADASSTYTKTQVDTALNAKANASTTYTKTQVDNLLNSKASADSVYTKTQADSLLNAKANQATTYTKSEVDALIAGIQPGGATHAFVVSATIGTTKTTEPEVYFNQYDATNERVSVHMDGFYPSYTSKSYMITVLASAATGLDEDEYVLGPCAQNMTVDALEKWLYFTVPLTYIGNKLLVIIDEVDSGSGWYLLNPASSGGGDYYTKSEINSMLNNKLDSSVYYTYVNNRPIDKYLFFNYPGIPSSADDDFTVYATHYYDYKDYDVTVVLDDPNLKFKSITYDQTNNRFAVTFPKEVAGHTGRVHVKEVTS